MRESSLNPLLLAQHHQDKNNVSGEHGPSSLYFKAFCEHHVQPSVSWESFSITSDSGYRSHPIAKTPLHPPLSAVAGLSWASHPRYKHYKPFWASLPQVLWGDTLHKGWSLLGLSSLLSAQELKQIETRTEEKCQKTVNLSPAQERYGITCSYSAFTSQRFSPV